MDVFKYYSIEEIKGIIKERDKNKTEKEIVLNAMNILTRLAGEIANGYSGVTTEYSPEILIEYIADSLLGICTIVTLHDISEEDLDVAIREKIVSLIKEVNGYEEGINK
jgi:hypothetical protein